MIPTLTFRPEYRPTNPPRLMGFHFMDESGKTVGVLPVEDVRTLNKYVEKYVEEQRDRDRSRQYAADPAKFVYDNILSTGMFFEWFPELSGNWIADEAQGRGDKFLRSSGKK